MLNQFSQKTQEELKYYVYALTDPSDGHIFYIGKGIGNRVFAHQADAIFDPRESDKLEKIRAIHDKNQNVKHYIIRHGLEENEALLLEATLIDFLTFSDFVTSVKMTNLVAGHHSFNRGIQTVEECEALYNCEELKQESIRHKLLVININKSFDSRVNKNRRDSMPSHYHRANIYEATRGWWVLDNHRAKQTDFVLAEYRGVVRAIFKANEWLQNIEERGPKRWGFEGEEVTDPEILNLYLNKEVPKAIGMANPIRYFGPSTRCFACC